MILLVYLLLFLSIQNSATTHLDDLLVNVTGYKQLINEYEKSGLGSKAYEPKEFSQLASMFSEAIESRQKLLIKTMEFASNIIPSLNASFFKKPPEEINWAAKSGDDEEEDDEKGEEMCQMITRVNFDGPVCVTKSFLHVPIDVYKERPEITKAVKWSSLIDPQWRSNLREVPDLTWQYFASSTGLLRFFPGTIWPKRDISSEDEAIDLYDVRRRSWYMAGMSLPKKMLIMIDSSGSSQGQALALMKHTAKNLLNTLTENDRFNVINFPVTDKAFTNFARATYRNKRTAIAWSRNLTSSKIANFSEALQIGFELYEQDINNKTQEHCNRLIMLLTDGGAERPVDVLAQYNSRLSVGDDDDDDDDGDGCDDDDGGGD